MRNSVKALHYSPGDGPYVRNLNNPADTDYNVWTGWGCEPVAGDVSPFLDYLSGFDEIDDELLHFVLCWLAYPIQHPGAKLNQSIVLFGDPGAGKTMLGSLLSPIYGKHYGVVGRSTIERDFNGFMMNRSLVLGDEITGTSKSSKAYQIADKLKSYITEPTIEINRKNVEPFGYPQPCQLYLRVKPR